MNDAVRLSWAELNRIGTRDRNQDRIGAATDGALACFVVADGAGGHQGGETAAQLVVDTVLAAFRRAPANSAASLAAYVDAASSAVAGARTADPALREMSSTVALLVVDQAAASASWAHLGDSRIYLLREGAVHAVSRDHSLARQLIDAGYAPAAEDVRSHPRRHVLLAAIGAENGIAADISHAGVPLLAGDALLLCSDGLWQYLDDAAMLAALPTSGRSEDWLDGMCAAAEREARRQAGDGRGDQPPRDDYSAYAIRVHAPAQRQDQPREAP